MDEIENPRLQHLKTKITGYNFSAEWVKENLNHAPDALSRNPVSEPQLDELLAEGMSSSAEVWVLTSDLTSNLRMSELHQTIQDDEEHQQLKHRISSTTKPITGAVSPILEHSEPVVR